MLNDFLIFSPIFFLLFIAIILLIFGSLYITSFYFADLHIISKRLVIFGLFLANILFFKNLSIAKIFFIEHFFIFNGLFHYNFILAYLQLFLIIISLFFFILTYAYDFNTKIYQFEFSFLILSVIIGNLCLMLVGDLVSFYVTLEMQTVPFYILIASFRTNKKSIEAALKYFTLSVINSAVLLFGLALVYYVTGLTNFYDLMVFNSIASQTIFIPIRNHYSLHYAVYLFGQLFLIIGLLFKLSAAPLHFWVPDVYDGAPISITFLLSSFPKYTIFLVLVHFSNFVFSSFLFFWGWFFTVIGLLSLFVGTLGAFTTQRIARIVAYGGVAHVGFILLTLNSAIFFSFYSFFFYLVFYVLTNFLFFGVWLNFKHEHYLVFITELSGLFHYSKFLSLLLMVAFFSYIGIPPFIGFFAKLLVLKGLVLNKFLFISFLTFFISVLSAAYYLRIVHIIFFSPLPGKPIIFQQTLRNLPFMLISLLLFLQVSLPFYAAKFLVKTSFVIKYVLIE